MIEINEILLPDLPVVDGYGPGFFRICGEIYRGSILILPQGVENWRDEQRIESFRKAALSVDFLLYGSGAQTAFPSSALNDAAAEAEIGLEPMTTPSACRTYNILLGEGRRLGALLTPLPALPAHESACD